MSAPPDSKRAIDFIRASGFFDIDWYRKEYPDVELLGIEPVEHYVRFGARLGRNPHPLFDAAWYATYHADIARTGKEPLLHFLMHGRFEGRKTMPVGGRYPTYSLCVDRKGGIDSRSDHWDAKREAAFLQALERTREGRPAEAAPASVIMPTYNRAARIPHAIRSVLAQSHHAWELVVVDDGSTDETEAVVAPFLQDKRIRYVRQEQAGVAKARNTGLRATSLPYVCYLDSDNTWRPGFLSAITAFMSAVGLEAAYTGAYCFGDKDGQVHYRGDDFSWRQCLRENYVDMNCFAHRRDLVERYGDFDERLMRLVDWDFILRLTRETKTAYAPFCGVDYYDGEAGDRITNTQYIDGTLRAVASRIRAKHHGVAHDVVPRPVAEELLGQASVPGLRPGHTGSAAIPPAYDRRVGYVAWDWPALSQTFVINEVRGLIERGCDVTVYHRADAEKPAEIDFPVRCYRVEDADALARLVRAHGRSVLHSPFAYPATTLLTWPCSVATGIPFTFMPGGVDISHYANIERNRVGEVASSPGCLGVVTLGTYHRDFLVEQGVPADKIVLQPQSVALPLFCPRERVRPRPRLVTVARYVEKKGLGLLLDAAAELPDADFHLYGYGPLESALRAQARLLGLLNVHFEAPPSSRRELHDAYAQADLFVLPCVRAANGDLDGLPTVILEAMGAGVPVVSTRISNIPDVVVDGETGILAVPGDVASLVAQLRRAIAFPVNERRALVEAARRRVENHADAGRSLATLERIWSARGVTALPA